jgi:hypothetical protein
MLRGMKREMLVCCGLCQQAEGFVEFEDTVNLGSAANTADLVCGQDGAS